MLMTRVVHQRDSAAGKPAKFITYSCPPSQPQQHAGQPGMAASNAVDLNEILSSATSTPYNEDISLEEASVASSRESRV